MATKNGEKTHKWTDEEREYIRVNAASRIDEEIARDLSTITGEAITVLKVRSMRRSMGIRKKRGRSHCSIEDPNTIIPSPPRRKRSRP